MRGGIWDKREMDDEMQKWEDDCNKFCEELKKVNATAAEKWAAMAKKFDDEIGVLADKGYVNPTEAGDDLQNEEQEFLAEDPVWILQRRNYTEEDPFVNPWREAHDYFVNLTSRPRREVKRQIREESKREKEERIIRLKP